MEERRIGRVRVLFGEGGGKYPDGNALFVEGREESLIIDPALGVVGRGEARPRPDRVLNSHCHEDHIAGNFLYPEIPWCLHEADAAGLQSMAGMMEIYGFSGEIAAGFETLLIEQFNYQARPDVVTFRDGDVFDLGGTSVRVLHAQGHTRGHCVFHIEPEDVIYLADIDLSSFGPYYGDAWSDLEDFSRTLAWVSEFQAKHYATFHHIGVLDGFEAFRARFDRFAGMIPNREARLLEFLVEPRSLEEVIDARFIYSRGTPPSFAPSVERRSMTQHIDRLIAQSRVVEVEPGRYRVAA